MKRHIKRQKDYEVTKEGWIHVYPSMDGQGGMPKHSDTAVFLRSAAKSLVSLIVGRDRFWSLK